MQISKSINFINHSSNVWFRKKIEINPLALTSWELGVLCPESAGFLCKEVQIFINTISKTIPRKMIKMIANQLYGDVSDSRSSHAARNLSFSTLSIHLRKSYCFDIFTYMEPRLIAISCQSHGFRMLLNAESWQAHLITTSNTLPSSCPVLL